MRRTLPFLTLTALTLALPLTLPTAAHALTLQAQGALQAQGGGPVADGFYAAKFKLYAAQDAKTPVWDETWLGLEVKAGLFHAEIGTQEPAKNPLPVAVFTDNAELWLAVQISVDPELPRVKLAPVPFAVRAQFADKLLGQIQGTQIADNSLPAKAVGFSYAGSDQKGGAASDVACTGCIGLLELEKGVLDAKNVAYGETSVHKGLEEATGVAKQAASGVAELAAGVQVQKGAVGLGKTPADGCKVDLAGNPNVCVDGAPATLVLQAANQDAMQKLAKPGQLVLRTDTNQLFAYVGGNWRVLQFQAVCGDGAVDPPETCDDKNGDDTDACVKCQKAACGDGFVQKSVENCDDGNQDSSDACVNCQPAKCGDGAVQAGVEKCEAGKLGSATCASVAGAGATGELGCAGDCKAFDTSKCVLPAGTESNPAASCKAVQDTVQGAQSGAYWLKHGSGKVRAYCDLTTDGGGWVLASNWNYSDTPAQWGSFEAGNANPAPGVKHALPFVTLVAAPKAVRMVYKGNNQTLGTLGISGGWEKSSGKGVRIKLSNGNYLIYDHQGCGPGVDTPNGFGVCYANGNYSDGYTCDGNSGQVSGSGLFNVCTQDENGCSGKAAWQVNGSVQICGATDLVAVYLR